MLDFNYARISTCFIPFLDLANLLVHDNFDGCKPKCAIVGHYPLRVLLEMDLEKRALILGIWY